MLRPYLFQTTAIHTKKILLDEFVAWLHREQVDGGHIVNVRFEIAREEFPDSAARWVKP
jgi:hypothetical protein